MMTRNKWLTIVWITVLAVAGWLVDQSVSSDTGDTYEGMSIIPEQHEDIPLFAGLEPREHEYVIKGNRWEEIYQFYLNELPRHGWRAEYKQSGENWTGFMSRWRKPGFDGKLWIHGHYNQADDRTEVIYDKTLLHTNQKKEEK